jgi:small subunit ribosomal protein S9
MNTILEAGKRKRAIARATLKEGQGRVFINGRPLTEFGTPLARARISEAIILAGKEMNNLDVRVNVRGGGVSGQADAARLAIGRALAQHKPMLKQVLLDYDRTLLVADVRRKESAKPNSHGQARAKRQKSYR